MKAETKKSVLEQFLWDLVGVCHRRVMCRVGLLPGSEHKEQRFFEPISEGTKIHATCMPFVPFSHPGLAASLQLT